MLLKFRVSGKAYLSKSIFVRYVYLILPKFKE